MICIDRANSSARYSYEVSSSLCHFVLGESNVIFLLDLSSVAKGIEFASEKRKYVACIDFRFCS